MGGSLARAKAEGRTTGIIDLTRGEAATKGTPEIRTQEVKAASKVLALDVRQNLGWPDSRIMDSEDRRLQLAHVLRELRPRVVIAPHHNDRHPDHVAAAHIVPAAVHLAGLKNSPLSGEPYKPKNLFFYMGNGPFEATLVCRHERLYRYVGRGGALLSESVHGRSRLGDGDAGRVHAQARASGVLGDVHRGEVRRATMDAASGGVLALLEELRLRNKTYQGI